jgi:signal recognition particle subunit SRP54
LFEGLSSRLDQIFANLRRKAKLSTEDVESVLKEVRIALLEADVNYLVVKELISSINQRAIGAEVSQALNPAQQVIKIVYDELITTLGEPVKLVLKGEKPRTLLLVGLQGSGKTTAAAKLARLLQAEGERVMLVAADPYRPAAALQLTKLGNTINVPVFSVENKKTPEIVRLALTSAKKSGVSILIIDTAGRSQLDQQLMDELKDVNSIIAATEVILVVDAMTGQEAVKIAAGFQSVIPITGLFFTKMDGDARGGAAISIRKITGVPIKLIGIGESLDAMEIYSPKRLADRILGMGDVVGLIEKAEKTYDERQAAIQSEKFRKGKLNLEDFSEQLQQIKKMGSMGSLLDMLPGNFSAKTISPDEANKKLNKTLAIIHSMTMKERRNPEILNANRRRRIATGSGSQVQDVNRVIKEFHNMQLLMKKFGKLDKKGLTSLLR